MAQGDLFSRLTETSGVLDRALRKSIINAEEHSRIMRDLSDAQLNIYNVRRKMLKSETDSLNILKRTKSVGDKIFEQLKNNKKLKKDIGSTENQLRNIEAEILKNRRDGNTALMQANIKVRNQLKLQNQVNKVQLEQLRKTIPLIGRLAGGGGEFADALVSVAGTLGSIFKVLGGILGVIGTIGTALIKMVLSPLKKAFSVFLEMQSVVGNLAADIGLTAIESKTLLNNFASLTISAMRFGGTMQDVATIFKQFSETTNKNRFFNEREIGQLIELGLGTSLGVEGAAELASSFDNIGISLEKTINLTEKARNMSARMNLNATKVLKTYQGLVESLTGIGFGRGLDNLAKLSAKAMAIRFDIVKSTEAFKDAFFEPEKAVEAAAKMQVLGGKFAQNFGDPMQLAFESINEPEKLAERVTELVKGSIVKSGDSYIIPPAERRMLQIAAETLGQDYNDIYQTTIEQAKIADKMTALSRSGFNLMDFNEEDRLGLSSLMQMNEKGKFEIRLSDGTTQLLENITDKNQLKQILDARKANERAAIGRKNVMERLSLIVDRFMVGVSGVFNKLFGGTNFESFLDMVEKAGGRISDFIVKDLLGKNGLTDGFSTLVKKASDVFKKIEQIFTTKGQGSFVEKVGATLKVLFKDVFIEIVKFVTPFFKAGIAELIDIIGGALPGFLGGNSLKAYASKLRGDAAYSDQSGILGDLYKSAGANVASPGDRSANQGMAAIAMMKNAAIAGNTLAHYGKVGIGAGMKSGGMGLFRNFGKRGTTVGNFGLDMAMKGKGLMGKAMAKKIPILGGLLSLGLAAMDAMEGDYTGASLQAASGLLNIGGSLAAPFSGGASLSMNVIAAGLDATDAAREMGYFDDGVIYKDGSYAKFGKGDMVQFIDQAAMERAGTIGGGGSSNVVQHSGVITIKSDDGKVVTWDQMYGARDLIGARISSITDSYNKGFGNYQNPNKTPIQPLL